MLVVTGARLIVVRHGRTAWNATRFLGRIDVPLDAVGEGQAERLADALAHLPVERVWSSPLRRAVATAGPLVERFGLVLRTDDALSEIDCGTWEGQLKAGHVGKVSTRDLDTPMPGGESVAQAWQRVGRFAEASLRDLAGGCTVVVGHYLVNQLLVARLTGGAAEQALRDPAYRPAPGSILALTRTAGAWQVDDASAVTEEVAS